jgi:hypothetical protein
VRIRVTRQSIGELDGVSLSRFEVGKIYEVATSIATYLIFTNSAESILEERSAFFGPTLDPPRAVADDE